VYTLRVTNSCVEFPVVKEIIQALVGDSRIETDKIGLGNYYWLFPSAAANKSKRKLEQLEKDIEESEKKKVKLEEEIEEASAGKEDSEERQQNLQTYKDLQAEKAELDKELKKFADFDPELVKKIESDAKVALDAANRWTDNIFALQGYTSKNFFMASADFFKNFEIDPEIDNLN
jgi:SMC interacting uncharacterized protein involved in chromosome segregation